jgi:DNA-directed RNA polymerase subunit RPC12/RpoP
MYLPGMRDKAIHRCKDCRFFVIIKGRQETRLGCVANIKAYYNLEKRVPREIDVHEIIKRVGLEGLEYSLKFHDPEAQSCGKFLTE